MKRIIAIMAAAVLLLSLAACGSGKTESAASAQTAGMANPWSEAGSADEAAQGAGVGSFQLPENGTETSGGQVDFTYYQYMEGLAEADGAIGAAELTVRKGLKKDGEDVSGDYTEYAFQWTQEAGGLQISCSGNEDGKTMKAIWTSGDNSYCFLVRGQGDLYETYGIDADAVEALVTAIQ